MILLLLALVSPLAALNMLGAVAIGIVLVEVLP
jgi:hypothetical protein